MTNNMPTNVIHVIPLNDLREHIESIECWCKPTSEECEGGEIVSHHAMDKREVYETGEMLPH